MRGRPDAADVRRHYGVPEALGLEVQRGEVLAWADGARDAVWTVASGPDDLAPAAARGRAALARLDGGPLGPLVAREYRKGGLLRRLRGRRFRGRWRPLDELVLHRRLLAAGVPVAEAVGAVVLRHPTGWRGFLLLKEVRGALDVEAYLRDPAAHPEWPPREVLALAGAAVRALHDAGVAHADLHPKNLLLDPATARVLVIDLDRACARDRPLGEEERLANLVRLGRSVEKHRRQGLPIGRRAALRFLAAYGGGPVAARRWLERVRERLRRDLPVHVLWWKISGQARPRGERALPPPAAGADPA